MTKALEEAKLKTKGKAFEILSAEDIKILTEMTRDPKKYNLSPTDLAAIQNLIKHWKLQSNLRNNASLAASSGAIAKAKTTKDGVMLADALDLRTQNQIEAEGAAKRRAQLTEGMTAAQILEQSEKNKDFKARITALDNAESQAKASIE